MSHQQFAEWVEFYGLEPWGFMVDDEHNALIAAVIANSVGSKQSPDAFRLGRAMEEAAQAAQETEADRVAKMFGVKLPPRKRG